MNRLLIASLAATVFLSLGCPVFSPPGGDYQQDIIPGVEITCEPPVMSPIYRTDPSEEFQQYTQPIPIQGDGTIVTIEARCLATNYSKYKITYDQVHPPVFDPPAGTYEYPIDVAITSATPGATIYYTTDKSPPTTLSPTYTAPINVAQKTTIRAIAVYNGPQSEEREAEYVFGCYDSGSSTGDPHFFTFDGLGYHDQSIGEFVLSREVGGAGYRVQVRQGRLSGFSRCVSLNKAVAIRLDTSIIEYRASSNEILLDGGVIDVPEGSDHTLPTGGIVRRVKGVVCTNASETVSVRAADRGSYLNIVVTVACSMEGTLEGLLGDYDGNPSNDMKLRNGELAASVTEFVNDWRLGDTESLFTYAPGENTGTYTDVQDCGIHPSAEDIQRATDIYHEHFGQGACDDAMILAMAIDLAAGVSEEDVIAWVENLEGYVAPSAKTWYQDADGDGFGASDHPMEACAKPTGYVENDLDCDDTNPSIHPGVYDECDDGVDNNCDGITDNCCVNPAKSCLDILQLGVAGGDGNYCIELPSGVFEMYCDFTTDTGGWTRVGALDLTQNYCGNQSIFDLRLDPDATMGKVPDSDVHALMSSTPNSPMEVMYVIPSTGRYVWHSLQNFSDFDTSSEHRSSSFYCSNWHCDNGTTDSSSCGSEGSGCPVTAHGTAGGYKKIYVDFSGVGGRHDKGIHTNGGICGLPNYTRSQVGVFVR